MPGTFLSDILLVIIAAFLGGFSARTLKLPPVLGYIASGIVFGIIGKNIFQNYDSLVTLSQVGVSLLLFTLGFEISIDSLLKVNRKVFIVGILQTIIISVISFVVLKLFGLSIQVSILFAILFSFSSTATVVKILEEKGLISDFPGNNVFILLLMQDLFVVPVIFFLPVLFHGQISSASILSFIIASGKPLLIFAAIVVFGRLFFSKFLDFVFRYPSHELTILATIFTASFSILALISVGLPESIAAFLAGVLISEQGKNLAPLSEIRPLRDIFLVLFFVLTGMLLNFNFFLANISFLIFLSVVLIAIKFAVTYVLLRLFSYSPSSSVFISSYMSNIGEFAVVLGQIAYLAGFIAFRDYNLLLSAFVLSLIYIPLILGVGRTGAEKLARLGFMSKILPKQVEMNDTSEKANKFSGHVVICGHGRVGREVRAMLDLANIPYVVIDFNKKAIKELNSVSQHAIYGDPSDPEILTAGFIREAKVLVVAIPDSFSQKRVIDAALKINPKLIVLCRSHVEEDQYDLIKMGVTTVVMPELEAGLRMGTEVLELFKLKDENISSYIKKIRRGHLQ